MADTKNSIGKFALIIGIIVLAVLGINYLRTRNENKETEDITFRLPTSVDPEVFGPSYWNAFHTLARKIPCSLCRGEAESFMQFFHDYVNLKLGKPLKYPDNFAYWTERIAQIHNNNNQIPDDFVSFNVNPAPLS